MFSKSAKLSIKIQKFLKTNIIQKETKKTQNQKVYPTKFTSKN